MLLTLRSKIFAGYLFAAFLLAALGAYTVMAFRSFTSVSNGAYERISEADRANLSIYESLVRLNEAELQILGDDGSVGEQILADEPARITSELSAAEKVIVSIPHDLAPELSGTFTRLEVQWHQYQAQLPELSRRAREDLREARKFYQGVLLPTYRQLVKISRELSATISALFERTRGLASEESDVAVTTVIIVTLVSIVIGVFGSLLIVRRTTKPLRQLSRSLKRVQAGELDARLDVHGADELGEVSFEFNRMAERLERFEQLNIDRLLAEKSKSESVILSLNEPLFLFGPDGKLLLANRSSEELLGVPESQMIGKQLEELFRDPRAVSIITEAGQHPENDEGRPHILEFSSRAGRTYYRVSSVAITAPTTEHTTAPVGTLLHLTDITHFEELDRMKNDFLAKVSHEFRTPLTSITMALDILADSKIGRLNDDQRELVLNSKTDSLRLTKLIRDLLTISRIETDKGLPDSEPIDATEVVMSLVRSLEAQFHEKGIHLTAKVSRALVVRMKREHLESIVQNLLVNALAFTGTGGEVSAEIASVGENEWMLRVSDSGIGIAESDLGRIFDRFVQIKPRDAATPGSIGLGLAIVKELVDLYRGDITVTSEVGTGTTFTLKFPMTFHRQLARTQD